MRHFYSGVNLAWTEYIQRCREFHALCAVSSGKSSVDSVFRNILHGGISGMSLADSDARNVLDGGINGKSSADSVLRNVLGGGISGKSSVDSAARNALSGGISSSSQGHIKLSSIFGISCNGAEIFWTEYIQRIYHI